MIFTYENAPKSITFKRFNSYNLSTAIKIYGYKAPISSYSQYLRKFNSTEVINVTLIPANDTGEHTFSNFKNYFSSNEVLGIKILGGTGTPIEITNMKS